MVEKRRGLGRGLGALIPSAPVEEVTPADIDEVDVADDQQLEDPPRKGRPVDLFFERVTEDDVVSAPRSYSSALRSGINKSVLETQTKRAAKSSPGRKAGATGKSISTNVETDSTDAAMDEGEPSTATLPPASEQNASPESDKGDATLEAAAGTGSGKKTEPAPAASEPDKKVTATSRRGARTRRGTEDAAARSDEDAAVDGAAVTTGDTAPGAADTSVGEVELRPVIADRGDGSAGLVAVPGAEFAELDLDSIHANRKQPRVEFNEDELAELVHSIREIGVLQPVVVRPSQEGGQEAYELVMGERRWRASREAGLERIPAIIRSTLDDDLLRDALLENLHRSALNPLEEAAAYQQLLDDFGCSHDELAGRLGRSRPQISNTLRLMKLPPLVQRRVAAGVLSAGHARALLGLSDAAEMEKLAQRIVAEGLSVRSTEEIVALNGGSRRASRTATPTAGARHERLDYLATSLSDRLDTNVKITLGAKKGRVSIEFASVDDLNRIVGVLTPKSDS